MSFNFWLGVIVALGLGGAAIEAMGLRPIALTFVGIAVIAGSLIVKSYAP